MRRLRIIDAMRTLRNLLRVHMLERVSIAMYVCAIILTVFLFLAGLVDFGFLVELMITSTPAVVVILATLVKSSTESNVISVVAQYMLKGDISLIDELLGKFITGKWEVAGSDPAEGFFATLEDLARDGDYETRRRITEALPALFQWKLDKTERIATVLRSDWDADFKTDIRRRVVESIRYLLKKKPESVKFFLEIREEDEIYTAMAIAEVANEWLKVDEKKAERFLADFKTNIQQNYSKEESDGVTELLNLLKMVEENKFKAVENMDKKSKSNNIFIRIGVARNLHLVLEEYPKKCFSMMDYFLRPEEHENVRRPIAKENSTKAILNALKDLKLRKRAETILWKLIKDSDDIIRVTTFDLMDDLREIDIKLCQDIVAYVVNNEKNHDLLRRARRLQELISKGN